MRVGIDARMSGAVRYGGIGRYVHNLLAHQAADYTVFAGEDVLLGYHPNGHRTVRVDAPVYSLREQVLMPLKLRHTGLDLLHVPHYNVPIATSCPLVVTVHDIIHLRFPASRKAHLYARFMLPLVCRKARHIIVPSETTASDLRRSFDIPPEKLSVVPHGVEARFRPEPDRERVTSYRRAWGLPSAFILYVGGTRRYKDVPRLVHALAILRKRRPDLGPQLVIAGHEAPATDPRLRSAINDHEVEQNVTILGSIPDSELPMLYNAATVLAFPSRYEGSVFPCWRRWPVARLWSAPQQVRCPK